ncbi:hypothetical protein BH24ACI2_BH24ACI2_10580 [soil metagenome]
MTMFNKIMIKLSFLLVILFSAAFLSSCTKSSQATDETAKPKETIPMGEIIANTDNICRQHEDLSKLRECIKLLAAARNPDNRNYEVEWKFAKYNYFLGKQTEKEEESEKAFKDGVKAGKIASRIEPNKPDGYFWHGANLGEQAKRAPLTKGLTSVDDIRAAMNKVIEIEPSYQGASAYDVLAQIELATGLTGGKPEKAVEYLEKALELEKENSLIRLHLAEAYLKVNRKADAKKQIDYLLQMKPDPDYLPEYEESTKKAKELLKTKF